MSKAILTIAASAALLLAGQTSASAASEHADVIDQDGVTVLAPDGARVQRQPTGLSASLQMPAPVPDGYVYPAGTAPGSPEVFTLWMFVFNHPEHCTDPCGPDDTTNPDVEFGAYNLAGHPNADGTLTLSGHVNVGDPAGAPPGVVPHPLSNPAGAVVHLAVTSHGGLNPADLPGEFRRPTGSPVCGCWWTAAFD